MKVKILFSIVLLLLVSNYTFSQESYPNMKEFEKLADSIYFTNSDYTQQADRKKGISLYDKLLLSLKDTSILHYKKITIKKHGLTALFLESENQYDSAIVYSKKAIKLQNKIDKQNLLLKGLLYQRLYKQWTSLGRNDSTLFVANKALKIFKDTLGAHHKHVAETVFDIGMALGRQGDMTEQIVHYKRAIAINMLHKGEYTPEVAIQEHHLAITYGFIGFYKKELESYKKVIERWENMTYHDMSYLNVAYGSISAWYLQHGDVKTAEQYLLKQESLIKKHRTNIKTWFNETYKGRTKVTNWYRKANLAVYKKDTAQAFLYLDKILDFVSNFDEKDPKNNPHNISYFKNFVNLIHMHTLWFKAGLIEQKKPNEAMRLYEKTLTLDGVNAVATTTLAAKLHIIDYYISIKDFATAREKLEVYIAKATELKSDFSLIRLFAKEANLEFSQGRYVLFDERYTTVFKKLQNNTLQSINIQDLKRNDCKAYGDIDIVDLVLVAGKNYGKAYLATSNQDYLEKAHNLNELTSQIFSENFSYLPFNESKYATLSRINEQLLNTALLLKEEVIIDQVLENIEQTGSRLSWKKFLASKQLKNLNIPDSIIERENNLKSELLFYKKALFTSNESNVEKVKRYKEKLYDVEIEIERLGEWYREMYPGYFNQTQKPFDLDELRSMMKKNQRILKYVIADEHVYAFLITKNSTDLQMLEKKEVLNKKLTPFIASISIVNTNDYKKMAQDLYKILLPESLLGSSKNQNLIFIQDDILNLLPMEILLNANEKYLIQSHSVSYAPSLLLWNEQLRVKKSRRNKLGIFAPTYKDYYKKNPKRNDSTALFGAFSEAMQIADLFKSDVYSGSSASKQEFINKAKGYTILHLAMHSTINNENAEFSNLSFSPDRSDNKLYISELYNIPLNADLAVLSACNTGAGVLKKGEGLVNISRAFTYAGVPSIVTSLWNVPDKETSEIMVSFYTFLKKGKSKSEALQLAKLGYLKNTDDELLKHPYYWAGFVVSGDISPIESSSNKLWMYLVLGILFAGLIFRKKLLKLF